MEHIKNIEIKNFKSIRDAKINDCKRVNVFIGPPNVGKSNILEGLSLFGLLDYGISQPISLQKLTRVNKFYQLFFDGLTDANVNICLNNNLSLDISASLNLNVNFSAIEQMPIVKPIDTSTWKDYPKSIMLRKLEIEGVDHNIKAESYFPHYINPIKSIRKYIFNKSSANLEFDILIKHLVFPFGENISDIIFSKAEVKNKIIKLFEIYKLRLSRSESKGTINLLKELQDSSFLILDYDLIAETLRRLIFYMAAILTNKKSVLLFEEPEANCFEPYIMEITNAIKNDDNQNQFFIVTHSQYVIDELMKDEESRNDTNIYLVGLEKNETKVKLLSSDISKDVYQTELNVFFNYQSLWDEN